MCRSIKTLRYSDHMADEDEIEAAALQFIRKLSGYRKPSKRNEAAFNLAVYEVTAAARRVLESIAAPEAVA